MKLKTRKSAAKRIKIKKHFFERKKAFKGHLLRNKTAVQLRKLSEPAKINKSDEKAYRLMLPYA